MATKKALFRRSRPSPWLNAYLGLVAFGLLGSLLSRLTGLNPGPIAPVCSLLTLLCGLVAAFLPAIRKVPRDLLALVAVLLVGAAAELIGVATGLPFGRYVYTDRWWPTVPYLDGRFPLLVPFGWVLVAGSAFLALSEAIRSRIWRVLAAATLAAVVDLFMEPTLAGPLDYWRWLEPGPLPGGAPIANFVGWWVTSLLGGTILATVNLKTKSPETARSVLIGHLALIVGIGLIHLIPAR